MRFVPIRTALYVMVISWPALAQPTLISREMPHLEVSAGLSGLYRGPNADVEPRMAALGLNSHLDRIDYPRTYAIPGLFAELQAGVRRHAMLGVFVGSNDVRTEGQSASGTHAQVFASVRTRAVLASYRPNPWLRVGAGPALVHRRLLFEGGGEEFHGNALGWLATADVKLVRKPMTYEHPPVFVYATGQYRGVPGFDVRATTLPTVGPSRGALAWPAQHVRMSHWLLGLGFGLEI